MLQPYSLRVIFNVDTCPNTIYCVAWQIEAIMQCKISSSCAFLEIFAQIKLILWAWSKLTTSKSASHLKSPHSGLDHFSWHHSTITKAELKVVANPINILWKIQTGWFQIKLVLQCHSILHCNGQYHYKAKKIQTANIFFLLFCFRYKKIYIGTSIVIEIELLFDPFSDAISRENANNNRLFYTSTRINYPFECNKCNNRSIESIATFS